ncbi:PTS sugar transporter subunit IIA [Sutcliffiella rhizosphaerae]|uniref:PTS system glucose-specific EIIA component n=1 Tax=Sutcliffiella rhizosphaerae TaxID=2880967 RepID=A0ABN8A4K2_9BACI|nr:PTS glucose transporter subunit IIA [Sutcliffiella rhizosphaerae]CAG9620038.1 PTS system glucose-specific EIIA component [Sutcliffiella rhizosphaerae]
MSFFKKLFGKNERKTEERLVAPITGRLVPLEEVPDPVFAERMMGDGIAIEPTEGTVVSPVNGEIVQFFPTKHAIGIKSETGVEVLIHVGLETVGMKGEGFEGLVNVGDKVSVGTPLLHFDVALIKEKAKSVVTPIILTNGDILETVTKHAVKATTKGETALIDWKIKS